MNSAKPTSYTRCITGQPAVQVTIRGRRLVRYDTIQHKDGSFWRYEGMCRENTAVSASSPDDATAIRRFSMEEFGLTVMETPGQRSND